MGPNLDRLWAYQCLMTKTRNVSCMAWNKVNLVSFLVESEIPFIIVKIDEKLFHEVFFCASNKCVKSLFSQRYQAEIGIFQDLLAVGYGQFDFIGQKAGMVCCWSLKNPEVNQIKFSNFSFHYLSFIFLIPLAIPFPRHIPTPFCSTRFGSVGGCSTFFILLYTVMIRNL